MRVFALSVWMMWDFHPSTRPLLLRRFRLASVFRWQTAADADSANYCCTIGAAAAGCPNTNDLCGGTMVGLWWVVHDEPNCKRRNVRVRVRAPLTAKLFALRIVDQRLQRRMLVATARTAVLVLVVAVLQRMLRRMVVHVVAVLRRQLTVQRWLLLRHLMLMLMQRLVMQLVVLVVLNVELLLMQRH